MAERDPDGANSNVRLTDETGDNDGLAADGTAGRDGLSGEETDDTSHAVERRTVLKLAGTTAAAFGLSTLSGTSLASSSPSNVVDLGNEGLSSGDDISPYLETYCVGGNEVHIPEGTYSWDGVSGIGGSYDAPMWLIGDGSGAVLDVGDGGHCELDILADSPGVHFRMENITQTGVVGQDGGIAIRAGDPDALIEFVQFDRPDGCEDGVDAVATYVDDAHAGVARFVNCYYEGFSNNGVYGSSPGQSSSEGGEGGLVEILGGLYKNCDVCGVRIGSNNSRVESVAIVQNAHCSGISGGNAQRGIYVREAGENMVIKDCDITMENFDGAAGSIIVADDAFSESGGSFTIDDCRIRNEIGAPIISTASNSYDASGNNLHLTGSGSYELEGAGPYDNVCTGSGCDSPTTQRRWYGSSGGDGGGGDTGVAVSTGSASSVGDSTATLEGSLDNLGGADSADVAFDYREAGASSWSSTGGQTLSSTGTFSASVDGLATGTDYEFRASADASDGDTDTGTTTTFTTTYDHHLVISTFDGSGISYTLTTSGELVKGDTAEGNDSLTQNSDGTYTADGFVANNYDDDWHFNGEALDWNAQKDPDSSSGDYQLTLDGQAITADELTGDTSVAVSTGSASSVGDSTATLEGSLDDLGGADSADVAFDYREAGTSSWSSTAAQTLSSTGTFSASVDVLATGTDYEFRARADASDGDTDTGTTTLFTTGTSGSGSAPTVDRFQVTEADSPNPHADITVDWVASDADADLSWVLVQVLDTSGSVVDASRSSVSGDSAADVNYFKIKHADGQTFDVRIEVADDAGQSTTATKSVTE